MGIEKIKEHKGIQNFQLENLANCNGDPNMLPSTYPLCNLFKQPKVASSIVNAQAQMLPKVSPINHQTAYSLPPVHAQIEAKETDVQAISKLTHALEKKAYASREGGGNTFEKIEEAIDHVNDQLSKDYPYILAEGSFVAADAGNLTSHELFNPKSSSLQEPSSRKLKNPLVHSELITKCVATLLMIQNCTERHTASRCSSGAGFCCY